MIAIRPITSAQHRQIDPDARLMLRVGKGDQDAFALLVDRYYHRVLSVIQHLMGGRHQVDDLAQEVFMRVYRARERYRPESKFSTWLFVIVNNVVRNARRSLARRPEVPLGQQLQRPQLAGRQRLEEDCDERPVDALLRGELRETVRDAIEELNSRQRTAILLYHFAGLSYAEIADTMDTSLCAAKALLHRARSSLRGQLQLYVKSNT